MFILFPDPTFESLKAVITPDGKSVMSRIELPAKSSSMQDYKKHSSHSSLLCSLVRPLHYRTIKLSTPLISRKERGRKGREGEQ